MNKIIPYILLLLFLNSCSPIIKTHGYTIENTSDFSEFISEIATKEKVSKQKILGELGSPSIIIDDVDNTWLYILSTKQEKSFSDSELRAQFIIKLAFDANDLMISHEILTGEDFNKIAFSKDTTKGPSNSYGITDQFIEAFTRSN
jgi:outer membrane protein assembly factor BamE (lipoprotein component of BamABCDE complex)